MTHAHVEPLPITAAPRGQTPRRRLPPARQAPAFPPQARPPATAETARPAGSKGLGRPYLTAVPDSQPPFDDELPPVARLRLLRTPIRQTPAPLDRPEPAPVGSTAAHILPSAFALVPMATSAGLHCTASTIVADPAVPLWSNEADVGVCRTGSAALPAARKQSAVMARALIEVLSGHRIVGQLRVHCAPDVFAGLVSREIAGGVMPHLINVRVCEPADGIAEVSAVFRRGDRVRALAFRMQGLDGRWRITALQTG